MNKTDIKVPFSQEEKIGLWEYNKVRESETEDAKLIFIHGLASSSKTWEDLVKLFHDETHNCSIWFFDYHNGVKRHFKSGTAKDIINDARILAQSIDNDDSTAKIVFIAHSLGGILTLFMLQYLITSNRKSILNRIVGLFFFSTPFGGSGMASFLNFFDSQIKDLEVLSLGSDSLTSLHECINSHFNFDETINIHSKVNIPAYNIIAEDDNYINEFSSSLYVPSLQSRNFYATHSSIIKAKDKNDEKFIWVYNLIKKLVPSIIDGSFTHQRKNKLHEFNLATDSGVISLVNECKKAFENGEYINYYNLLKKYSLKLKKNGRHGELCEICLLDVERKQSTDLYPTLTYCQTKFTKHELRNAFEVMEKKLGHNQTLKNISYNFRLQFIRTYSEILISAGYPELAQLMLEVILEDSRMSNADFRTVSHSLSVLAKSYMLNGSYENAEEIYRDNLGEAELTTDRYGIAISQMNLGVLLISKNIEEAKRLFSKALITFSNIDVRASAWANLYLAYCNILLSKGEYIAHLNAATTYYSEHHECSPEYLKIIKYVNEQLTGNIELSNILNKEIIRCTSVVVSESLTQQNILSAKKTIEILEMQTYNIAKGSDPLNQRVSNGVFKARSLLVKSFIRELNIEKLEQLLSEKNYISNTFYNAILVEHCQKSPELISKYIIPKIDLILNQTDSIKLFYARFFEKFESFRKLSEKLLGLVSNKSGYAYFSCYANVCAHKASTLDVSLDFHLKSIQSTDKDQLKAISYNNMAHAIQRHAKKEYYGDAIDYCNKSISLRYTSSFYYPESLLIALMIDNTTFEQIDEIIHEGTRKLGGNKKAIQYISTKIHDKNKKVKVEKLVEGIQKSVIAS